ncbi:NADH dehydrogenase [Dyadobacter frigoris]|uniref:NAD(P)/FAD-dependent oxidoreductase n=1 Tax=Dyadobacter frigoris TaxID=2576211 RepID=UPI00249F9D66|nr:NAD(P)/FAD-dependent oxidoreductase [Dyadobacter frigoris]GLU55183.1 NADH dehydrogenase [Dyadobacter frigoris]
MSKHIVVIGGGFAGINLVKQLAGNKEFTVTLVDRNNYNFFPPLLYQIATGFLEVSNISYPFRRLGRQMENVNFHLGEFVKVIPSENQVVISTDNLHYDYLVFAAGVSTNYFGMENVKQNALPMKTVNDALELRNHILAQMELAAVEKDAGERKKLLSIVVAGGGPTGVEISGMLAEMRKNILPKDYPEIAGKGYEGHIYLVDGADAVLKPMSQKSQRDTYEALTNLGVEVKLNMQVKDYCNDVVTFANGETIETKTLVWAAGVTGSVFEGIPVECYGRSKRLITDEFNRIKGLENIYAIGDISIQNHEEKFPAGHPQMAQIAIQQGRNLAGNFKALLKGNSLKPFAYWDKGSMAIIGRNKAVADLPNNIHFFGFIAWCMWIFVHLLSLVTNRNKFTTFLNWLVAYFTKDQSLRMIIRPGRELRMKSRKFE